MGETKSGIPASRAPWFRLRASDAVLPQSALIALLRTQRIAVGEFRWSTPDGAAQNCDDRYGEERNSD